MRQTSPPTRILVALTAIAGRDRPRGHRRRPRTSSIARLREASRSGQSQRVIFKAKPGYEAWARKLLAQKGKNIDAELPSVGAFAVELTAGELDVFCNSTRVRTAARQMPIVSAERASGAARTLAPRSPRRR